jgi:glycosyltransferase involved in cell wall biosynthesis
VSEARTLFVHGRPAGHPLHARYGRSITDKFSVEDPLIRCHDKNLPAFARYFAWVINSFAFVSFKRRTILTEGFRITIVIAKIFSFNRIKLVMLVADESPYFLVTKYYSRLSWIVNHWGYNQYDGFICIGQMETELVRKVVAGNAKQPIIMTTINGISTSSLSRLSKIKYEAHSRRIAFIGSGPARWREYYKGVDLLIKSVGELIDTGFDVHLEIAGEWDSDLLNRCGISDFARKRISLVGYISDVHQFLTGSCLYVHVGRGDAWPIAIMEAMAGGTVPIVSEWTGAKECVKQVSPELVVDLEASEIVKKMRWFFELSHENRTALSDKCREVVGKYLEERAIESFKTNFKNLIPEM